MPNELIYEASTPETQFAVFSEMFYEHGWNAYLDGEKVSHYNVDYVLRGMEVPAGQHKISFKFEPQVIKTGSTIALASSILLGLLTLGGLFYSFRNKE